MDDHTSYNSPTSYSYWCSHLNQTTHIAWSPNHFPYSVTLSTQGQMISRLSTRAPFPKPQPFQSRTNHFIPLSWFILWTIDRPIYLIILLLKINPKVSLSNILNRQYFYSKNFFENEEKGKLCDQVNLEPLIPLSFICLTKVRMFWETIKLFCKFF